MSKSTLAEFIQNCQFFDTHEHLISESTRNQMNLDFTYLFPMYIDSDLISSGMRVDDLESIRKPGRMVYQWVEGVLEPGCLTYPYPERLPSREFSEEKKWKILSPYWEMVKNTAYCKSIQKAINSLFGIKNLTNSNFKDVSAALNESRTRGWYERVLKEKAGIALCLVDNGFMPMDDNIFHPIGRFHRFAYIADRVALGRLEHDTDSSITSLKDLILRLNEDMQQKKASGMKAVKIMLAYRRSIYFDHIGYESAERIFDRLFTHPNANLSWEESKPLQDFMIHEMIQAAMRLELPIQIHTGIQTGNGNVIANSAPHLLTNLFIRYQKARFDLLHAGFPYQSETTVLAKTFPNVYANLCWLPIISPSAAEHVLNEWIEAIPASKIFTFGGDYTIPEGTLGHAIMTREVILRVLQQKVNDGYLSLNEAQEIAQKIMFSNASAFYSVER